MAKVRYTVISIARGADEPAWREQGARSSWSVTLADSAGTRYLLQLTQPIGGPMPFVAGAVRALDARLLCAAPEESPGFSYGKQVP